MFARSMRAAVAAKLIPEAPVGRDVVDLPEVRRKRERFLTEHEVNVLASAISPKHRPLVLAAPWTGCRWGELTGALKENLDLARRELRVRSVAERVTASRAELKAVPKTKSSWRTVSLPAQLVEVLERQVADHPHSPLVFPNRSGGVLSYRNFRTRHWDPAVEEAGVAPLTFHDLRHTHVAWLIDAGWTEFRIVRRMGWKDGRMLHTVYGHLFRDHDEELMADLEARWASGVD